MLSVSLLAGMCTGCTIGDTEIVLDVNNVGRNDIFSINGVDCTKDEARLYLCNYQNLYGNEYGVNLWDYDYSQMDQNKTLEAYVKEVTLAELANVMCMSQIAEERGITLTESDNKLLEKVVEEYYGSLSKDEIAYMGIDKNELKKFYERYAMAHKLYTSLMQGLSEEVSDDEARVVQIQQIIVADQEKAETVKQQLESGANFMTVAGKYNEAQTAERYLTRGEYAAEVDAVVFRLDNNEQSGMITAKNGYYFIKCIDKFVEDMTETHKTEIFDQRRKDQFDNVLNGFIKNSEFAISEKRWADVKVDTSGAIKTDSFFAVFDKYFVKEAAD